MQFFKVYFMQGVDLKQVPQRATLVDDDEQIGDVLKLPPEKMLLRWKHS